MQVPLSAALGTYPHTSALKDGLVKSDLVRLEFADIKPISRAFAPMVRNLHFDVSEMAIATFLQAKCFGKQLVLLPIVLAARFQERALLCRADGRIAAVTDLVGRRIGVRAYSQTSGMWLRGIMSDDEGIRPADLRWITFEEAHVEEIVDPPWVARAVPGQDMRAMLLAGEIDAAIFGNDVPDDPELKTVYADPEAAGADFERRYGFVPVNHVLTVKEELARDRPDLLAEILRMFRHAAPGHSAPCELRRTLDSAICLALRYMAEQGMLPHRIELEDAWAGLPADVI